MSTDRMWRARRKAALALCVLMLLAAAPAGAEGLTPDNLRRLDSQVREAFDDYSTYGGALALAKDGEVLHTYVYGNAVARGKVPVTEDTLFRVASVTKTVVAIGVMRLVEQDRLDLDEDIGAYLGYTVRNPRFPDRKITLRQLLSHTSGIKHNADYALMDTKKRMSLKQMLCDGPNVRRNYQTWEPGERYEYSNFGAGVVGSVIEAVTGQSLDQAMRALLFAPLNISACFAPAIMPEDTPFAVGYTEEGMGIRYDPYAERQQPWEDKPDPEQHYDLAAGSLNIRAVDLAKVMGVLANDGVANGVRILKPETARAMCEVQTGKGSVWGKTPHGLGIDRRSGWVRDRMVFGHQGTLYGILCDAFFDPLDASVVVMVTNACKHDRNDAGRLYLPTEVMRFGFQALDEKQ